MLLLRVQGNVEGVAHEFQQHTLQRIIQAHTCRSPRNHCSAHGYRYAQAQLGTRIARHDQHVGTGVSE